MTGIERDDDGWPESAELPCWGDNGSMAGHETGRQPGTNGAHLQHAGPGATGPGRPEESGQRPKARDLNELIRYTMWSVFRVTYPAALDAAPASGAAHGAAGGGWTGRPGLAAEVSQLC